MPPSATPDRVAGVKSASISDAIRKLHPHRAHVTDLLTPTPSRVLFGPAVTIPFVPVRADVGKAPEFDYFSRYREAVGDTPAGKVLVLANYGPPAAAVAGGVRLARLDADGVAGLVTNGRLRDFDEIRGRSFAAYCRGETPVAGSAEAMACGANVPVSLDGATVIPGDYVYADGAGAVVIPAGDVDRVLELARAVEDEDARRVAKALDEARTGAGR